jgi:hypothetical protein
MTQRSQKERDLGKHNLNEYNLGCLLKPAQKHLEVRLIRPISATELDIVKKAIKQIGDFGSCCALYEMCEKNYQSILSYNTAIKNDFPSNRHRVYEYTEEAFQEMNRLLLNYLSSFKTFIDHLTSRYTRLQRQSGSFLSDFKEITAVCYDGNFSYRFFSKLRDYVQHRGLPFGSIHIEEKPAPDGSVDIDILISFNRDALISDYKKWGKVKADLERQPEHMEPLTYINGFQSQIQLINLVVSGMEISSATESWQSLNKLIQEVRVKCPSGIPIIGRYLESGKAEHKIEVIEFPFHTMRKLQEKLKEVQNFQNRRKAKD